MPLDPSAKADDRASAELQPLVEELTRTNRELQDQVTRHRQSEWIVTGQRDLGFMLAGTSSITDALKLCLETAIRLSGLDGGGIYMIDPSTGSFHLACIQGVSASFADQVREAPADSDRARMALSNRPAYLDRAALLDPLFEDIRHEGLTAVAMIPISSQNRVIGILNVASRRHDLIPSESRNALEIITTQIGASILRAQADDALRASEKKFRDLADLLPQPVFECDEGGDVTFANFKTSEVFGYSREDLKKGIRNIGRVFSPEDADKISAHLSRLRNGQKVGPAELTLQRKDGSTFPAIVFADPIFRDNGTAGFRGTLVDITERRRMEAVLRESESKFRNLTEKSVAGIYLIQDGILQYVNSRFAEILGYDAGEMVGALRVEDVIFPGDWPLVRDNLQKRLSGEVESLHYEFRIRKKNGEIRRAEVYSSRTSYLENPAVIGTLIDITERRQAEAQLRESEARLRQVIDLVPHYIFAKDRAGRFILANRTVADAYGTTVEGLTGKSDADFNPDKAQVEHFRRDDRFVMDSGEPKETPEEEITDARGRTRTLRTVKIPFTLSASQDKAVLGVSTDITEQKLAQKALQESEVKYRSVVESSLVGFYIVQDGLLRFVNQRFCDVTGYSYDEIVDRMSPTDLVHPEDRRLVAENLEKRQAEQEKQIEYSFRVIRKDGRVITVKVFGSATLYHGRKAICGTSIDITRERTMEAQLHQSQKMEAIGTLAGGIAHDFNNILGGIVGYAGLAQLKTTDTRIKPYLEQILRACDRSRDLVNQILTFSRQKEHERKPLSVTPVIKEALKLIRSSIPSTVEIRLNHENFPDTILADPTQIHQVLINLCTNAAYAMRDKGGILSVGLSRLDVADGKPRTDPLEKGSYLKLDVADTGQGIDPTILDKIFDPFYTTKGPGEGTGLGLSMVYGIVKNHDGVISVSSKPGEGTTFTICLPLIDSEGKPPDREMEEMPIGHGHVLFVDDEEMLASIGKEMLAFLGYDVTVRFSSLDALEAFRGSPDRYDLVITDTTMPNMTGNVLAAELLKLRPGLPIILTSGFSDRISAEEAKRIGIREFIMKPIALGNLSRTVRRVLDQAESCGQTAGE